MEIVDVDLVAINTCMRAGDQHTEPNKLGPLSFQYRELMALNTQRGMGSSGKNILLSEN